MDRLLEIFERQEELEEKYRPIERANGFYYPDLPIDLEYHKDQMAFRENNQFLVEELFEATNLLKNKPWKQTKVPVDREKFIEEMGDQVHFFVKSWLYVFGDAEAAAEALYSAYMGKSVTNKQRQENKY